MGVNTYPRPHLGHVLGQFPHYNDIIMGSMASQITSLTIVYSVGYSGADQRKKSKLRVTGLCTGNSPGTGEFPAQMASNAKNVSIWWRHGSACHMLWLQTARTSAVPWRFPIVVIYGCCVNVQDCISYTL